MIEAMLYIAIIPVMMFMIAGIVLNNTTIRNANMTTYDHFYVADCSEGVYEVWAVEDEDDFVHTHMGTFYSRDEAFDEMIALHKAQDEGDYTL